MSAQCRACGEPVARLPLCTACRAVEPLAPSMPRLASAHDCAPPSSPAPAGSPGGLLGGHRVGAPTLPLAGALASREALGAPTSSTGGRASATAPKGAKRAEVTP